MDLFVQLYRRLDQHTRTNDKVAALEDYFRVAPREDAAWALFHLVGRRLPRAVSPAELRAWAGAASGLAPWLVEECYAAAGDLAETLALLVPPAATPRAWPLSALIEHRIRPLRELSHEERRARIEQSWHELDGDARFLYHKMLTGGFRVGISRALVERALSRVSGVPAAELARRLMGDWPPDASFFERLLSTEERGTPNLQPYPFYLAYPLEQAVSSLGDPGDWQAEWKWDGIRAQALRRAASIAIWTRGEELVTERYPEIERALAALPEGTALDGELLAWREDRPLPFGAMQRRIGRLRVSSDELREAPVIFMAYDLLEFNGVDIRAQPLSERRARLEAVLQRAPEELKVSPTLAFPDWPALAALRAESRARRVEGIMLKRRDSPYGVGRERGAWWKWKVDPYTVDAVLMYAQAGHGRRAGLHTDYTLGVWNGETLVPVAKAYSGLTDRELEEVDRWIRRHTIEKHGPVRVVVPELVFEIAFEGLQPSPRHKSGIALRFPRVHRWRRDKMPADADRLEQLVALMNAAQT